MIEVLSARLILVILLAAPCRALWCSARGEYGGELEGLIEWTVTVVHCGHGVFGRRRMLPAPREVAGIHERVPSCRSQSRTRPRWHPCRERRRTQ